MARGVNEPVRSNSSSQIIDSTRSGTNDDDEELGAASTGLGLNIHNNMPSTSIAGIEFIDYVDERQLEDVMRLVGQDLSEPYSVFTYRYFLHRWPKLCILAVPTTPTTRDGDDITEFRRPVGCVVCKIDIEGGDDQDDNDDECDDFTRQEACFLEGNHHGQHDDDNDDGRGGREGLAARRRAPRTGYIGMLAVENTHRRSGIGSALVQLAIHRMKQMGCQSIRLETEVTNKAAISLYENRLGFLREELLKMYYLNWGDAYRLRLWLDG